MGDTRSDAPNQEPTKTQIARRCSVETGRSERVCYGVLYRGWPITNSAREEIWRWAVKRRIFLVRDHALVVRPKRVRKKPAALNLKPTIERLEALASVARPAPEDKPSRDDLRTFRPDDGPRDPAEAAREFDRIVEETKEREKSIAREVALEEATARLEKPRTAITSIEDDLATIAAKRAKP